MGKNTAKDKKKLIKTIKKPNNGIEVEIQKSPGKTLFGKVFAWIIVILTVLLPLAVLIFLLASIN